MGGLKEKTELAIELERAAEAADAHVKIRYNPEFRAEFVEDSSEMAKYNSGALTILLADKEKNWWLLSLPKRQCTMNMTDIFRVLMDFSIALYPSSLSKIL
ncbi:MAG: hypothetical protein KAT65_20580 [Methanophagales archaeon]|nr:hypothetical protein [Methanophagales archaeon]